MKTYITAKSTNYRLSLTADIVTNNIAKYNQAEIKIDTDRRYQVIQGFGGAFTEAAASVFHQLPNELKKEIITAYFHQERGHGYTFGRTHINSCDFSLNNYAYAETPGDSKLADFNIQRDRQYIIPFIKDARSQTDEKLNLLASPWSPPAWMKTNGEMNNGGKLKMEYRQTWADYYCRYVMEYKREDIPIWGISVQNEPEAQQTWDSCLYTAEEERNFVKDFLGPALARQGLSELKLIIWDHNRDLMYERAKVILNDPAAAQYVWGTGFHWYNGDNFDNVQRVHDVWPQKGLIFTEGCQEGGPHISSWDLGERYARSIINDLNRWTEIWLDWNLLLDERGGPNHVGNYCSAPIIVDTKQQQILYQSSFYYLGHFSRFIKPGSTRIFSECSIDQLDTLASINPDGTLALVVLNRSKDKIQSQLKIGQLVQNLNSLPRSITTILIPFGDY